jgi:hypothetical protein
MNIVKSILIACFLTLSITLFGQSYLIGKQVIELIDASRNNRSIPVELYYPASTAGLNASPISGQFSSITIGHGFAMGIAPFEIFADQLTPQGYVIALVNTENGLFSVSHPNFGLDIRFVNNWLRNAPGNSLHPLQAILNGRTAIMGHSMGGGSGVLASANNTEIDLYIGLAPAETNPSAIEAAQNVTAPSIIFSGQNDGVTPPTEHHLPIYNSLSSSCKYFISVLGGGHCAFAASSFTCNFGENASNPQPSITANQQLSVLFDFLSPALSTYLDNDLIQLARFNDSLDNSTRIQAFTACENASVSTSNATVQDIRIFPNPGIDVVHIAFPLHMLNHNAEILLLDLSGKTVIKTTKSEGQSNVSLQTQKIKTGSYILKVRSQSTSWTKRLLVH